MKIFKFMVLNNTMKNIFFKVAIIIIVMVTMSIAANAQEKGDMAVGTYLAFGTGWEYRNGGIGAKFLYNASNRIRFAAEIDSWRKIKDTFNPISVYNINAYAHLLPSNRDKRTVIYPFIGIGRETRKISVSIVMDDKHISSITHHNTALLLGGGMDYKLTSKLILNTELRLHQIRFFGGKIGENHRLIQSINSSLNLAVGLAYKF